MRLKLDVEDAGQRADHQRLGQARHAFQQAMPAGEDGGEELLDHFVLPDDHLLQLLLHELAMLGEFLQDVAQGLGFGGSSGHVGGVRGRESGVRAAGGLATLADAAPNDL